MRRPLVATAAALAIALAAAACGNGTEPRVTAANPLADSADQVMFGISTLVTHQGVLRAQLEGDTAYFFDGSTRIEVRNEKTTFYGNTGQQTAVLTSREGTYNTVRGQMEARKHVVVITTDGKRLETEQLRYLQGINQVSSDSAFVLTEPTRTLRGIGFTSDPDLTNLHVKQVLTGSGTFTLPGQNP
jgi:LPS export ABC transporter protein LptC